MTDTQDRLARALLALRLAAFLVLIVWTTGKFINPAQQSRIYGAYYGVELSSASVYVLGALELIVVLAFLLGIQKRVSRALVMAMVWTTVLTPGRLYFQPFMDHILLYFAFWTMLAGCFALYVLRDADVMWTIGRPPAASSSRVRRDDRLPLALFVLRASVFFALSMWCLDKFLNPTQTTRILGNFYNIKGVSFVAAYGLGLLQAALILAFVLGLAKRVSYGLVLLSHIPAVLAPWSQYLHPYGGHVLLFLGAFPMWSACFAVYYLRDEDAWTIGGARTRRQIAARHDEAHVPRTWGKPAIVAVAVAVAFIGYFSRVWAKDARVERETGPAMIALVQQQYTPSDKLLALHPTDEFEWIATVDPVNCTFQRPHLRNCWEVYVGVDVEGPDPNGRAPGRVESNFIVDADAMRIENAGAASRTLFTKRENR